MPSSIRPLLAFSSVHPTAPSTTYLPFLYQTQTIVQPWLQHPSRSAHRQTRPFAVAKARSKLGAEGTSTKASGKNTSRSIQSESRTRKTIDRNDQDSPSTNRSNTFLDILQEHTSKPKPKISYTRNRAVTMTQKEQEVFERLQNMSGKKKVDPKLVDGLNDEIKDEDLVAIFDSVANRQEPRATANSARIRQQGALYTTQNGKEEQPRTRPKQVSPESAINQSDIISDAPISEETHAPSSIGSKKKKRTKTSNRGLDLEGLLTSARSDHELWQLLDKHVFRDMRDLAVVLKEKEIPRSHVASPTSKLMSKTQTLPPGSLGSRPEKPKPEKDPLERVTNTYGPSLLHSARLFRTQFPHSPYAALLLPTIKTLGPISYVLAGSTALYNELLYIRWVNYRDLSGCADLIEDMVSHNILADERTSVVLQMANKTRAKEMNAEQPERSISIEPQSVDGLARRQDVSNETALVTSGTPVKSFMAGWWQLQGIEAGWARWINAHEQLAAITRKEVQRQQEEQMLANQASKLPPGEIGPETSSTIGLFAERQKAITDALEPEIELLTSEDIEELGVAAAAV